MADISERPTNVTAAPAPPADAPRDEPYRPLSLLAVAGFGLAAVYAFLLLLGGLVPVATQNPRLFALLLVAAPLVGAQAALLGKKRGGGRVFASAAAGLLALLVVVGVGGLLAYSGTNPWLLLEGPGWLVVAAAAFLCWLARSRIAGSEGTLGGASLAGWGLTLSLASALVYGLYLAANTFAIRSQAREVAEQFIRLLGEKDDPESLRKAFLLMLPVRSRPASDIRRDIELQHNQTQDPTGRMVGPFTQFRTSQYTQLLRMGVDKVTFERVGASTYERGAYHVGLIYKVEIPVGTVLFHVGTQGVEVADDTGVTRRRWQVMPPATRIEEYRPNAKARQFENGARLASELVTEWLERVRRGDTVSGYVYTLPDAERKRQFAAAATTAPALPALVGVTLPGALGATSGAGEAFAKGVAEYRSGKLLDTQSQDFFAATDQAKQQMIDAARTIYTEGPPEGELSLNGQPPAFEEAAGKSVFLFPGRIITRARGKDHPSYMIECDVEVVGSALEQANSKDFRIGRLRLIRGQLTPQSPRPGG